MLRQIAPILLGSVVCAPVAAEVGPSPIPQGTHDWGCEVLLCLSNPAGPTAVPPCVPPIHRLWRALARGHAFPTCELAVGPAGRSYARPAYSHYDRCPEGTTELPVGQLAELATPMSMSAAPTTPAGTRSTYAAATPGLVYGGIGSGDAYGHAGVDGPPPPKLCVAGYRGSRPAGNVGDTYTVQRYDAMFLSPAQASPRAIDVFIDDAYWHTVRW